MVNVLAEALRQAGSIVDRGALRLMERAMARNGPGRPPADARVRLLSLVGHYSTPTTLGAPSEFFPDPPAAEVRTTRLAPRMGAEAVTDLVFPSTYRPFFAGYREEHAAYTANTLARARLYHAHAPRPIAICIHGWGGGAYWIEERAFTVPYWLRVGLDVALVQLPFHAERAPHQGGRSGALFPSSHVVRTNEAFGQAVHDLRALIEYLRDRGAPAVGVMGMSLGGYTTALLASLLPDLAFAVPMIPAVTMAGLMWRHGSASPQRRRAERVGVTRELIEEVFAVHSPLSRPVRVPRERLMIVAGRGDRITPPDQAQALWEHWDRPAMHWFPGGHLAQIGRGDAFRAVRRHLAGLGLATAPLRQGSGPASRR